MKKVEKKTKNKEETIPDQVFWGSYIEWFCMVFNKLFFWEEVCSFGPRWPPPPFAKKTNFSNVFGLFPLEWSPLRESHGLSAKDTKNEVKQARIFSGLLDYSPKSVWMGKS